MKKTHWKKLDNPNYLGAYSLIDGETKEMTFTIEKVILQKAGKNDDECKVAYLKDSKPMILNTTNCKVIEKIYNTPFIEDWAGKELILYIAKIKAFGEDNVEALRIKQVKPELPELLPTNKKNWDKVLQALGNGYTIDQIQTKWKISEENREKLISEAL